MNLLFSVLTKLTNPHTNRRSGRYIYNSFPKKSYICNYGLVDDANFVVKPLMFHLLFGH